MKRIDKIKALLSGLTAREKMKLLGGVPFTDSISIKMEPELRHVLAHLYYAVESLCNGNHLGAMDNLKSIEGLVFFDGDEEDWESYFLMEVLRRWPRRSAKGRSAKAKRSARASARGGEPKKPKRRGGGA